MTSPDDSFWTRLDRLRGLDQSAPTFWPRFLEILAQAGGATQAAAYRAGAQPGTWREIGRMGFMVGGGGLFTAELLAQLGDLAQKNAVVEGSVGAPDARQNLIAVRLPIQGEPDAMAVLVAEAKPRAEAQARLDRLRLLADRPEIQSALRKADEARRDSARVAGALDLLNQLNAHREFLPAAMALCNELAARLKASSVALGWRKGDYVRLKALSNVEHFAARVEMVRELEAAMEEAFDQDDEIVWPATEDSTSVARVHGQLSGRQSIPYLVSVPLRSHGEPVGVLHLQRSESAFSQDDVTLLRVLGDQSSPWLSMLHEYGVWWGARFVGRGRKVLGKLWGVEHAWTKLGIVAGSIVLLASVFLGMNHRVEAPFILRSSKQAILPAPFDGFIQTVEHEIGDPVDAGTVLMTLDESTLRNRETSLQADEERFEGEAKNAESAGKFAEYRIAQAQARQSAAELAIVRQQIVLATLRAPFAGVVVEGRHRERIGAAVRQGELLFRVARTDEVFAELDVDEKDIHEIAAHAGGELAFTSRPAENFPIRVARIEPAGTPKKGANIFVVRAEIPGAARTWWRPGMTGVAKVSAGWHSFWWIATHRLVEFLRLKLWWW